jgi:hypothetical protein
MIRNEGFEIVIPSEVEQFHRDTADNTGFFDSAPLRSE